MLLYSTILNVKESLTKEKFIQLVIQWNQESPYEENIIPGLKWDGQMNVRYGNEVLWLEIEEYKNGNTVAIRYEKVEENGRIWNTDYVMNFDENRLLIQLDRSFTGDAMDLDFTFSTPHFLNTMIENGYLADDGDLPVTKNPIYITEENINLLSKIITRESSYHLPIVYVSKTVYNQYPMNVDVLSSRLKGVAHVLVQQSHDTDRMIRQLTQNKNEYFGAVGIYYPNKSVRSNRYLYQYNGQVDGFLQEKVVRKVMLYCSNQKVDESYTWNGVINSIGKDRLNSQRQERMKAETELSQVFDEFDDEMKRLQRRIETLTRENNALRAENAGLNNKVNGLDEIPVINMGREQDFYHDEIKEIVLSALDNEIQTRSDKGGRREHVLSDLLESNDYQRVYHQRKGVIQKLLKNYNGMTSKIRNALQEFGFAISEDGKHYRLTYFGDTRYNITLAKTPSENRGSQNVVHEIQKKVL